MWRFATEPWMGILTLGLPLPDLGLPFTWSQSEHHKARDYTNTEYCLIKFCLKCDFCIMTCPGLYYIRI